MISYRRALVLGTLTVGTLDILDAIIFFGIRSHVGPGRVFHSVAAGVLGKASFTGGIPSASLGLFLHYFISFVIVAVYLFASERVAVLRERPFVFGPLYGLVVFVVMNYIVAPMSAAAATRHFPTPVLIDELLIHMLGVGLPAALFARSVIFQANKE